MWDEANGEDDLQNRKIDNWNAGCHKEPGPKTVFKETTPRREHTQQHAIKKRTLKRWFKDTAKKKDW